MTVGRTLDRGKAPDGCGGGPGRRGGAFRRNIGAPHGQENGCTLDPHDSAPLMDTSTPATNSHQGGYQVDDVSVDLGPQQVTRAGTVIPLPVLSFNLLVTLVRAAPNLLTFDQLTELVWPDLVITPETISQRVKLLRNALGDDPRAPRYIGGVRGRGY